MRSERDQFQMKKYFFKVNNIHFHGLCSSFLIVDIEEVIIQVLTNKLFLNNIFKSN